MMHLHPTLTIAMQRFLMIISHLAKPRILRVPSSEMDSTFVSATQNLPGKLSMLFGIVSTRYLLLFNVPGALG